MPSRIQLNHWRDLALFSFTLTLVGCGGTLKSPQSASEASRQPSSSKTASKNIPSLPPAGSGRGAYYLDDGPGDNIPEGVLDIPDPEPQVEPIGKRGNKPYVVFGKRYTPVTDERSFKQRGIGSWYGKKFHGQRTSSGEIYDMYKMTAAHPTLPLPSYARVTNLANGRQVIVRVNDRGPFHSGRIIDLSYTAALKLGYLSKGSGELEVERLLPNEIARIVSSKREAGAGPSVTMQSADATAFAVEPVQRIESAPLPMLVSSKADGQGYTVALASANQKANAETVEPAVTVSGSGNVGAGVPGFYIQLGAYSQAGSAEAARSRLMQNWTSAIPPVEIVAYGVLHRLHSGPFATRAEAAAAALQLQNAGMSQPVIVQR